jgi:hypothetical protein
VDHQYRRNLDDYVAMCQSCHMRYDKKHGYGNRKQAGRVDRRGVATTD